MTGLKLVGKDILDNLECLGVTLDNGLEVNVDPLSTDEDEGVLRAIVSKDELLQVLTEVEVMK